MSLGLLLVIALTSCSLRGSPPEKLPIEFDQEYLNQQIKLFAIPGLSAYQPKYPVSLHLEYDTDNEVVFSSNYGLRLFIMQDGEWVEIQERPTHRSPGGEIKLSPGDPSSYGQIVTFGPQLDDLDRKYDMLVYVFGDMTTSDATKKVAAYTEFALTP
jgi:hypothetical protein